MCSKLIKIDPGHHTLNVSLHYLVKYMATGRLTVVTGSVFDGTLYIG